MPDRPKLTLVENLKQSIALEDALSSSEPEEHKENNVVDLARERMDRGALTSKDVTPAQLLEVVCEDVAASRIGNVVKCYVTLIAEDESSFTVSNYRAGLNRAEEVAFRQLGLQEAVDNWRFGCAAVED